MVTPTGALADGLGHGVKANILGQFPDTAFNALVGPDEVREALGRHLRADMWSWAQKRIGIDMARFGDDRTVLFPRQGRASFPPVIMRQADSIQVASRYALAKSRFGSEYDTIDDTGGWAGGVIDQARLAGNWIAPVNSSSSPDDPRYFNRRAEMWFRMVEWIKSGGALPPIEDLVTEICAPTYYFQDGKLRIEEKAQVKKRIGRSPDLADALALTFSTVEQPGGFAAQRRVQKVIARSVDDDDPLDAGRGKRLDMIADRTDDFGYEV